METIRQQSYIGEGSIANLAPVLAQIQARRVLLVTGGRSYAESGAEKLLAPMLQDKEVKQHAVLSQNPSFETVLQGITSCRSYNPDVVVAIGGGSVIDTAKSIAALSLEKNNPQSYITSAAKLETNPIPLIAIPTTAGTGSE